MVTEVDSLRVRIEADLGDIRRELRSLNRQVDKTQSGISKSFAAIGKSAKQLGAAVAVALAVRGTSSLVSFLSDVEEMRDKSAIVFGEFVDDVRAQLVEFGREVGRSSAELEGMAASIQDTFVPLGFAREEAAKMAVETTKLAVDVASLNNAADADVMKAFQSAIVGNHETVQRFGVIINQAAIDAELFRMGLNKSAKDATELEKVQARLNIITRGTSDAHGNAAATASSFANQAKGLKAELENLATEGFGPILDFATDSVTAIREVVKALTKIAPEIEKTLDIILDVFGAVAGQFTNMAIEAIEAIGDILGALNDVVEAVGDFTVEQATERVANFRKEVERLTKSVEDAESDNAKRFAERGLQVAKNRLKEAEALAKLLGADLEKPKPKSDMVVTPADDKEDEDKPTKPLIDLKKRTDEAKKAADELRASQESLVEEAVRIREAEDPLLALTNRLKEISILQKDFPNDFETLRAEASKAYAEATDGASEYKEQIEQLSSSISSGFASAFTSIIDGSKSAGEAFKDFAKTVIDSIIEIAIQEAIAKPLGGMLGGFLGDMLGTFGGSSTPGMSTGFTDNLGFGVAATGGSINPNRPYIVGERGPEIVVPKSASSVINSNNTRSAMSGGGAPVVVNQSINFATGISQTVRAEVINLLPQISEAAKAAVADSKQRGGRFSKAFA